MPDVLVRGLNKSLLGKLKTRAKGHRRSLQVEIKTILEESARWDPEAFRKRAEWWRKRLAGRKHSDSAALIAEDRRR